MKKIFVLMLAAFMSFSLLACGGEPEVPAAEAVTESPETTVMETFPEEETSAEAATEAAVQETEAKSHLDLAALYEKCIDRMPPMMPVDGSMLLDFMGIAEEDCVQAYVALAEDGLLTDELWLLEAKDQESLERLQQLAESRMKAKADETVSYSPQQFAVVEKGVILQNDLYLALIVTPDVEAVQEAVEAAIH